MQLAGYDQLSTLMTGRTNDLYRARDVTDGRWVALKVYRFKLVDDHSERLFRASCEQAVELSSHPHVADLYSVGITDNLHPYLAMELVEGATVAHRLTNGSAAGFEFDEVVAIGTAVAGALQTAHQTGAVHGMLSPASIMLTADGQPRLADLGVGMLEERWEAAGHREDVVPYHAAPEVIERGAPGPAADIYSLASTVYAMVAGHAPHGVGSVDSVSALLLRILQDTVPRLPAGASPELDRVLREALAADPEERTTSAGEFARQLERVGATPGSLPTPGPVVGDSGGSPQTLEPAPAGAPEPEPEPAPEPDHPPAGPEPGPDVEPVIGPDPAPPPPPVEPVIGPHPPPPPPPHVEPVIGPHPAPPPPPPPDPVPGLPGEESGPYAGEPATGLAAQLARLDSSPTADIPGDISAEVDAPAGLDGVRESDPIDAPATWEAELVEAPVGHAPFGERPPPPGDHPVPADGPPSGELVAAPLGPPVGDGVTDVGPLRDNGSGGALLPVPQDPEEDGAGTNRTPVLVLGGLAVLVVFVLVVVVVRGGGDDSGGTEGDEPASRTQPAPTLDDEPPAAGDEDPSGLPTPTDLQVDVNSDGVQVSWQPGGDDDYSGPFLLLMLSEDDRPRTQTVDGTSALLPVDLGEDDGYCFGVARADVISDVASGEGEQVGDYEVGAAFGEMSCIRGATEETVRTN